jgi:hypothetical protein
MIQAFVGTTEVLPLPESNCSAAYEAVPFRNLREPLRLGRGTALNSEMIFSPPALEPDTTVTRTITKVTALTDRNLFWPVYHVRVLAG